jgi:hypothetical protein
MRALALVGACPIPGHYRLQKNFAEPHTFSHPAFVMEREAGPG